ncbi:ribonuclease P complex subunit Pop2 [Cordyceps javanica]|uniref:Ribonuclease P complex subunit Pop2 n=1 Tax=Cordyceps javanica TaxID=43265 RepID=A0A545V579_9HYPO|nr:ribonuclease P complex subunit Pop2 [Cordyceps javanica]TQW08129.1 ribonuclease P complex subunit Pop2 [Cordyceps javanica]
MLYDLNIAWSPSTPPEKLLQTLAAAYSLGYSTVALNHLLEQPVHAAPAAAPFPQLPSSSSTGTQTSSLPSAVLHRATFPLADPSAPNYRLGALAAVYDVLAVRPTTGEAFQNACLTLDVPIISLDLTQHHRFHFRPKPCMAAVARGVRFEVCYAQLLNADARGRAAFIGNVTGLFRATRGRGIVVSSEARSALGLRAPADVVNLLGVWGLPNDKGLEGLRSLPRSVVVNEGMKRNGFRGIVEVVQTVEAPGKTPEETDGPDAGTTGAGASTSGGNKNQKRKPGQQEDGQQISKRQAKRMRLANRAAAASVDKSG